MNGKELLCMKLRLIQKHIRKIRIDHIKNKDKKQCPMFASQLGKYKQNCIVLIKQKQEQTNSQNRERQVIVIAGSFCKSYRCQTRKEGFQILGRIDEP